MAGFQVFPDAASMRVFSRQQRCDGKSIALVPTMGYLHAGHISLIDIARQVAHADVVIASIYVNPTQFAAHEDFGVYPASLEEDHRKLQAAGCVAVFQPASLYAHGQSPTPDSSAVVGAAQHVPGQHETFIQVEQLQKGLCGVSRPHFFRGVATVVAKLFNIVEPDVAVFGSKDYQQLAVIRRMVRDLDFGIQIVGGPIAREPDGLAMSSRNALLEPSNRQRAVCVSQALQVVLASTSGPAISTQQLQDQIAERIASGGGRVDYVEVVDAAELQRCEDVRSQPTLIAVAAFFGKVRLIDNVVYKSAVSSPQETWLPAQSQS
eukprot:jgi/Astpho2/1325/e_gw1.00024.24.1_t